MIINQHFRSGRMAGKMDLANGFRRKRIQRRNRIESVVNGIDEQIIEIEKDAAATTVREFSKKLQFRHLGSTKPQVAGNIFDEYWPAQDVLNFRHVCNHNVQRLTGIRHRQKIVEMVRAKGSPAQMFRDERRLDVFDEPFQFCEMGLSSAVGGAQ